MNTLGSWIDQEAFAGIARDLAPAAADAAPWFAEAATPVTRLMADDFKLPEHFAPAPFPGPPDAMAAPEREKVRHFLDNIRHKAEQSGLIPKHGPDGVAPPAAGGAATDLPPWGLPLPVTPVDLSAIPPRRQVPHFEVPLGPLTTRLRALTDWIRRQIDSDDIFIIDAQGCPVSDREASGEIVAGAVLLAEAVRRASPHLPSAAEGAIYLDLQDERRLGVIDTATRHGTFTLGLIVPDALAPRAADRLRRALRRTVEAEAQALTLPPRERW
jgi:hypothetical protein